MNLSDGDITILYIERAKKIKEWIEKKHLTRMPSPRANDEEERMIGSTLISINTYRVRPYLNLKTDEERSLYRQEHPRIDELVQIIDEIKVLVQTFKKEKVSVYLKNARDIKHWIEQSGGIEPPSQGAKDKEERRLANALNTIKQGLIKPYLFLENEQDKLEYKRKHPEFDEVLEIIQEIEKNNSIPVHLKNARQIKKWLEENGPSKKLSRFSENPEERRLALALMTIDTKRVKAYLDLTTDEERREFETKYPETLEILEIFNTINMLQAGQRKRRMSSYLQNAKAIKEWIEEKGGTRQPSQGAWEPIERKHAHNLNSIRQNRMKPYLQLKTDEERKAFLELYPETLEILEIMNEIDVKCGRKTLEQILEENAEKHAKLSEAKDLEKKYEELLSRQCETDDTKTQKIGEDIDDK